MSASVLKEAYESGRRAFFRGIIVPPYRPNTLPAKEWLRGFNESYFFNLQSMKKAPRSA